MTRSAPIAAILALYCSAASAANLDLFASRITGAAKVSRGGQEAPLQLQQSISGGDLISVATKSRVALQFADAGAITLAGLSDFQVFEVTPATTSNAAVGKFKLLAGAARVRSRGVGGKPPQDLRFNVGGLKTRVIDAEVWGANTTEGDTVCLLSGEVGVQMSGAEDKQLSEPGTCLRRDPEGRVRALKATSDSTVIAAIAATDFGDSIDVRTKTATVPPAVAAAAVKPAPASVIDTAKPVTAAKPIIAAPAKPVPAAKPAMPTVAVIAPAAKPTPPRPAKPSKPAKPPQAIGDSGRWTVVVLSMGTESPSAAKAKSLQEQGFIAALRTATVNGATAYRVTVGEFRTREEARQYADTTLKTAGMAGWVTSY